MLVPPLGTTGIRALADAGLLGPRMLAAHCVQADAEEIELLAANDVAVAHCPRSNGYLGCGVAPLHALREAGIRVSIATDSPASTPSFDMFDEMRAADRRRESARAAPGCAFHLGRSRARDPRRRARARARCRDRIARPGQVGGSHRSLARRRRLISRGKIPLRQPFSEAHPTASSLLSSPARPATRKEGRHGSS